MPPAQHVPVPLHGPMRLGSYLPWSPYAWMPPCPAVQQLPRPASAARTSCQRCSSWRGSVGSRSSDALFRMFRVRGWPLKTKKRACWSSRWLMSGWMLLACCTVGGSAHGMLEVTLGKSISLFWVQARNTVTNYIKLVWVTCCHLLWYEMLVSQQLILKADKTACGAKPNRPIPTWLVGRKTSFWWPWICCSRCMPNLYHWIQALRWGCQVLVCMWIT